MREKSMKEQCRVYAMLTSPDMGLRVRREGETATIMFIFSFYVRPMNLAPSS